MKEHGLDTYLHSQTNGEKITVDSDTSKLIQTNLDGLLMQAGIPALMQEQYRLFLCANSSSVIRGINLENPTVNIKHPHKFKQEVGTLAKLWWYFTTTRAQLSERYGDYVGLLQIWAGNPFTKVNMLAVGDCDYMVSSMTQHTPESEFTLNQEIELGVCMYKGRNQPFSIYKKQRINYADEDWNRFAGIISESLPHQSSEDKVMMISPADQLRLRRQEEEQYREKFLANPADFFKQFEPRTIGIFPERLLNVEELEKYIRLLQEFNYTQFFLPPNKLKVPWNAFSYGIELHEEATNEYNPQGLCFAQYGLDGKEKVPIATYIPAIIQQDNTTLGATTLVQYHSDRYGKWYNVELDEPFKHMFYINRFI